VFAPLFGFGFSFFKLLSVCLQESFSNGRWHFIGVARNSFVGYVALLTLSLATFFSGWFCCFAKLGFGRR
jgi:hypothetical protein